MLKIILQPMVILALLHAGPVLAASFDCAKASGKVEQLICADAALSALDEQLAQEYKQALALVAAPDALKQDQRAWLRQARKECTNAECLIKAYQARLSALHALGLQPSPADDTCRLGEMPWYTVNAPIEGNSDPVRLYKDNDGKRYLGVESGLVINDERNKNLYVFPCGADRVAAVPGFETKGYKYIAIFSPVIRMGDMSIGINKLINNETGDCPDSAFGVTLQSSPRGELDVINEKMIMRRLTVARSIALGACVMVPERVIQQRLAAIEGELARDGETLYFLDREAKRIIEFDPQLNMKHYCQQDEYFVLDLPKYQAAMMHAIWNDEPGRTYATIESKLMDLVTRVKQEECK